MKPHSKRPYDVSLLLDSHVDLTREDMMLSTSALIKEIEELAKEMASVLERLQKAQEVLGHMVFGATLTIHGPNLKRPNGWANRYREAKRDEALEREALRIRIIRMLSLLCVIARREDRSLRL